MTIRIARKNFRGLTRRRFLSTAAATGISTIAMPYLSRAADRRRGVVAHRPPGADDGRG
jgi:alkaline phosphatase D